MHTFSYSGIGLELTKQFEGLRLEAYQDCAGIWTVGYGHTGREVHPGQQVTALEAEVLLRADLRDAIACVNRAVAVEITLEQHHFDALVDFCFNVGRRSFLQSSLLGYINQEDFASATHQFSLWVNVDMKPVSGLVRRRTAEADLFRGPAAAAAKP